MAGAKEEDHLRRGLKFVFSFLMMKKIITILECSLTPWSVKLNSCPPDEKDFQ